MGQGQDGGGTCSSLSDGPADLLGTSMGRRLGLGPSTAARGKRIQKRRSGAGYGAIIHEILEYSTSFTTCNFVH